MIKDSPKTLTQEQKEAIVQFVVKWIKDGKLIKQGSSDTSFTIIDNDIWYMLSLSIFDKTELFSISVSNDKIGTRISVYGKDVLDKLAVKYIGNYLNSMITLNTEELTDAEFNEITNLDIDITVSRAKKIKHIKENM